MVKWCPYSQNPAVCMYRGLHNQHWKREEYIRLLYSKYNFYIISFHHYFTPLHGWMMCTVKICTRFSCRQVRWTDSNYKEQLLVLLMFPHLKLMMTYLLILSINKWFKFLWRRWTNTRWHKSSAINISLSCSQHCRVLMLVTWLAGPWQEHTHTHTQPPGFCFSEVLIGVQYPVCWGFTQK